MNGNPNPLVRNKIANDKVCRRRAIDVPGSGFQIQETINWLK